MITGAAKLAGVIGWPVTHSRSPRLHGAWLARHGIDGAYVPLAVRPDDLEPALRGLVACGFRGVNVTVPHKEAVMALCDTIDDAARAAGAVNTLVFGEDGEIAGRNTDGLGFLASLRAQNVKIGGSALLLGAGGAARAIAASLRAAGVGVTLCNRTRERADMLAAQVGGVEVIAWEQREAFLAGVDLVVNTTTIGMKGEGGTPARLDAAAAGLVVADIVYVPRLTPLLELAQTRRLQIVPGLGMLLHQAVPGFAAWFGVTPAVDDEIFAIAAADIPMRAGQAC